MVYGEVYGRNPEPPPGLCATCGIESADRAGPGAAENLPT
jgi:hypothetical protein